MSDEQFLAQLKTILKTNHRVTAGYSYTVPSPTSYPYQWLWDSCFHSLMWLHCNEPRHAEAELTALLAKQWQSGQVPHMLYWEQQHDVMKLDWGVPDTSTLTQPPLIAYAAWRVYQATNNKTWLKALFPGLLSFHQYILSRQRDGRGVVGIINPDESGEDNSPRFDAMLDLPPQHKAEANRERRFAIFDTHKTCGFDAPNCTAKAFWVEDVPFNVFTVLSAEALQHIALALGEVTTAERLAHETGTLRHKLRQHLLHDGVFKSVYHHELYRPTETVSWSHFAPLMVGLYTEAEAEHVVEHLYRSEGFQTTYRLPTVAATDPSYNPNEPAWGKPWQHPDWRGAIWMASNWCVYHGLLNYGYHDVAADLRANSLALVAQSGFRENYHPETGTGQGAEGFTWSGLIADMQPASVTSFPAHPDND